MLGNFLPCAIARPDPNNYRLHFELNLNRRLSRQVERLVSGRLLLFDDHLTLRNILHNVLLALKDKPKRNGG